MKKRKKIILCITMLVVLISTFALSTFAYNIEIEGETYPVENKYYEDLNVLVNQGSQSIHSRVNYKGNTLKTYKQNDGSAGVTYNYIGLKSLDTYYDSQIGLKATELISTVEFTICFGSDMNTSLDVVPISNFYPLYDKMNIYTDYAGVKIHDLYFELNQISNSFLVVPDDVSTDWTINKPPASAGKTCFVGTDTGLEIDIEITVDKSAGIITSIYRFEISNSSYFEEYIGTSSFSDFLKYSDYAYARLQIPSGAVCPTNDFRIHTTNANYEYQVFSDASKTQINGMLTDIYNEGKTNGNYALNEELTELKKQYNILVNSEKNSDAIPKFFDGIYSAVKTGFDELLEYSAFGISIGDFLGLLLGVVAFVVLGKIILMCIG